MGDKENERHSLKKSGTATDHSTSPRTLRICIFHCTMVKLYYQLALSIEILKEAMRRWSRFLTERSSSWMWIRKRRPRCGRRWMQTASSMRWIPSRTSRLSERTSTTHRAWLRPCPAHRAHTTEITSSTSIRSTWRRATLKEQRNFVRFRHLSADNTGKGRRRSA